MECNKNGRNLGLWVVIAIAITAASMSASKTSEPERAASPAQHATPRVSIVLPLLA